MSFLFDDQDFIDNQVAAKQLRSAIKAYDPIALIKQGMCATVTDMILKAWRTDLAVVEANVRLYEIQRHARPA